MVFRKALRPIDLKSEKLQEICVGIDAGGKYKVPYHIWADDLTESAYYRYTLSSCHYSNPHSFPTGERKPLCSSEWESIIIDHKTGEHLELPIMSYVNVRVKAPKANPKIHFSFTAGTAEVSEIRRIYFVCNNTLHLTLFAFMNPTCSEI